jgi:WD40 repeat protein
MIRRVLLWILLQAGLSASAQTERLRGECVDRYGDPLPLGATVRLGTTRCLVGAPISSLAFAHDGKTLACLDESSSDVSIWDVNSGKKLRALQPDKLLPEHDRGARAVSSSRNRSEAVVSA